VAYEVDVTNSLIVAIFVLAFGTNVNDRVRFLKQYNIPAAVTGGLACSLAVAMIYWVWGSKIIFDMTMRDTLLLAFFSTIGLSAKLRMMKEGGRALAIMAVLAAAFLFLQNGVGIGVAKLFGYDPFYGLLAGSISFSGGHGTSITWGQIAEQKGLEGAVEAGLACATMGLVMGGLIGGPLAARLMRIHRLSGDTSQEACSPSSDSKSKTVPVTLKGMITAILLLAICIAAGDIVNHFLASRGQTVPGFLTALGVGVLLTNLMDLFKLEFNKNAIGLCSDISLQLFLGLSLMSMQLASLVSAAGPLLVVTVAQVTLMVLFAYFVVFRVMGSDYDACVISVGYIGQGLGATPIGIANMHAVTEKYGASPKAFLVIPLIGAFFIDITNATVIQVFLALPLFNQ
jgi:glutamate:Na+ symporter, ESS family